MSAGHGNPARRRVARGPSPTRASAKVPFSAGTARCLPWSEDVASLAMPNCTTKFGWATAGSQCSSTTGDRLLKTKRFKVGPLRGVIAVIGAEHRMGPYTATQQKACLLQSVHYQFPPWPPSWTRHGALVQRVMQRPWINHHVPHDHHKDQHALNKHSRCASACTGEASSYHPSGGTRMLVFFGNWLSLLRVLEQHGNLHLALPRPGQLNSYPPLLLAWALWNK